MFAGICDSTCSCPQCRHGKVPPPQGCKHYNNNRHIKIHGTPKAYCKRYKCYIEQCRQFEDERPSKFWRLNLDSLQQAAYSHCYRFLEQAWTNSEIQVTRRPKFCTAEPNVFGPHSGTCVMSPFWSPECWGCSKILENLCVCSYRVWIKSLIWSVFQTQQVSFVAITTGCFFFLLDR